MSKKLNIIASVLFSLVVVAFLVAVFATEIIVPDKQYSETENRYLESAPVFSAASLKDGSFMDAFESWLSDQFPVRDKIVSVKTYISRSLGKTRINDVYCGENNRLFEVPSTVNESKLQSTIDAINNFSGTCNIENKYFLLAPNASYVYENELPSGLVCSNQNKQIESIFSTVGAGVNCVDVSLLLKNSAGDSQLYFRTDHHWTSYAALIAFEELARVMSVEADKVSYEKFTFSNAFSGTLASSSGIYETADILSCYVPENIQGTYYVQNYDKQEKTASVFDFTKLDTKNQYEVFFGGNFSRILIRTENLNEKNLLIFKDSYANCFIPLLIPHFENIVIIDPRYYTDNIDYVLQDTEFTHLLYLYNLNTFLEDSSLKDVLA